MQFFLFFFVKFKLIISDPKELKANFIIKIKKIPRFRTEHLITFV